MSKWIRGRLGRPIAGTIIGMLLVSLLLPLAPSPGYAQLDTDIQNFFNAESVKITTPLVIVDFDNKSGYTTGMPGRLFAAALTEEMQRTGTFDVVKRSDMQAVLDKLNLTPPLSWSAQAMVADRLSGDKPETKCNFTISGSVQDIKILRKPEGTCAEVTIDTLMIHRISKLPINGARITTSSSTKIGYVGNTDILVQEAMQIAAYQTAQALLDNRVPVGTILTSVHNGEVILKGGSVIGFRKGMELIAMRRDTVTGRLRIESLTPDESYCRVLDQSKGVALGDKAVPLFQFNTDYGVTGDTRNAVGLQLVALGGLALLATLVGTNSGDNAYDNMRSPTATPLADAMGADQPFGGNLVRWQKVGKRAIAYIIYRDTNPYAPIAIVGGDTDWYVDSATPSSDSTAPVESTDVTIDIDESTGLITTFEHDTEFVAFDDNLVSSMTIDAASLDVTCLRIPLMEGQTCGYRIRVVYMQYDSGGLDETGVSHPEQYRLYLGNTSASSARVTLTAPPLLDSPADGVLPTSGVYRCERVRGATNYCIQFSSDPTFPAAKSTNPDDPAFAARIESDYFALATYSLGSIYLNPTLASASDIYWRMGARVAGQPLPSASYDHNQDGWVFSRFHSFKLPSAARRSRMQHFLDGVPGKTQSTGGRSQRGRDGFFRR